MMRFEKSFRARCVLGILAATITAALYAAVVFAWRPDLLPAYANTPKPGDTPYELYPMLADGFLKGQLSLLQTPDPALLNAQDPYDPAKRPDVDYPRDASLYHGKFYIYFGPAPAVILFAPWKLLTGHDLPTPYAVLVFCVLSYLGLLAIYYSGVKCCLATPSRSAEIAALVTIGGATMLWPLLRRPAMYEAGIACGLAAVTWGVFAAWKAHSSEHGIRWSAACGLLFGIAVAARPNVALTALAVVPLLALGAQQRSWNPRFSVLAAAAVAGLVVLCTLLAYNYLRFGNILEFGQTYQLSATPGGERATQHFGLRFAPNQLWLNLFAPMKFSSYFPFVRIVPPSGSVPAGFGGWEGTFGILANIPVLWFAAWTLRGFGRRAPCNRLAGALCFTALLAAVPVIFFYGSTIRYEADFTPYLAVVAALGVIQADRGSNLTIRRAALVLALPLALWSAAVSLFAVVSLYVRPDGEPSAIEQIGWRLNVLSNALRIAPGPEYGPVSFRINLAGDLTGRKYLIVTEAADGSREFAALEPAGPGQLRVIAGRTGEHPFERAALFARPDARGFHELEVTLGSLYPLRNIESPVYIERDQFDGLKQRARISWDGTTVLDESVAPSASRTTRVHTSTREIALLGLSSADGFVDAAIHKPVGSMSIDMMRGGVRVRLRLTRESEGHSYPLGVTGQPGQGDFLFLQATKREGVRLGYNHWGTPSRFSGPIPVNLTGEPVVVEFWMPSMVSDNAQAPLTVWISGAQVWREAVPAYPAHPVRRWVLRNPIGGDVCETDFAGGILEASGLPNPP